MLLYQYQCHYITVNDSEDPLEKIIRFDVKIIGNIIDDPALDPYADEKRRNV